MILMNSMLYQKNDIKLDFIYTMTVPQSQLQAQIMLHLLKENAVTAPSACWPSELRWSEIHWFHRFS